MHVYLPIRICMYSRVDIIHPHEKMRASDNHMHCVESIISQYVNVDKAVSDVKNEIESRPATSTAPILFLFLGIGM